MTKPSFYLFAYIEFRPTGPLAEVASELGKTLGGIEFVEDTSGHFEEFPAYCAEVMGLDFALLGVPAPEYDCREVQSDDFELQVRPIDSLGPSRQDINISEFLVGVIRRNSSLDCSAMEYPKPDNGDGAD